MLFLRKTLVSWIAEAIERTDPPVPAFVKNKLSQTIALVAKVTYPSRWPRFLHDFLDLLTGGTESAADVFCRVLDAVDDEIVSGGGGSPDEVAAAARVKDAVRGDPEALRRLIDAWGALIACADAKIAIAATATARRYVDWMDVHLFVDESVLGAVSVARAALRGLDSDDSDRM
jgi:hypothetical protein